MVSVAPGRWHRPPTHQPGGGEGALGDIGGGGAWGTESILHFVRKKNLAETPSAAPHPPRSSTKGWGDANGNAKERKKQVAKQKPSNWGKWRGKTMDVMFDV